MFGGGGLVEVLGGKEGCAEQFAIGPLSLIVDDGGMAGVQYRLFQDAPKYVHSLSF